MRVYVGIASLFALSGCASSGADYAPQPSGTINLPPSLVSKDFETGTEPDVVWPRSQNGKGITVNQTTTFDYEDTREYSIRVCSGGKLTHFMLEPGERVDSSKGLVVFGDNDDTRWGITGKASGGRQIISLMAKSPRQKADMAIITNKRMYAFNLYSTPACHKMVKFAYEPQHAKNMAVHSEPFDIAKVRTNYTVSLIDGERPTWFPVNVFDAGGYKTWIEFPGSPGDVGAPTLLVGSGDKKMTAQKRIDGNFYEIVNMGDYAELSLGGSVIKVERQRIK